MSTIEDTDRHRARVRGQRLEARVSPEQKALFQRAADLQGRTLTDFVVASTYEAAIRTIKDMQTVRLTAKESRIFAEALLRPRAPTADLKAAVRRYAETADR
jgi:uncharacterized protein (DUF1778 family)